MTLRVLIADDEEHVSTELKDILEQEEEVEVISICTNGEETLQAMRKLSPHIAFLDISMPKLNGIEVARKLKQETTYIIYLTAYEEYAVKAFEVGAKGYILKPFSESDVRKQLHLAIEYFRRNGILTTQNQFRIKLQEQLLLSLIFGWDEMGDSVEKQANYLNLDLTIPRICLLVECDVAGSQEQLIKVVNSIFFHEKQYLAGFVDKHLLAIFIPIKQTNVDECKQGIEHISHAIAEKCGSKFRGHLFFGVSSLFKHSSSSYKNTLEEALQALRLGKKGKTQEKIAYIDQFGIDLILDAVPSQAIIRFLNQFSISEKSNDHLQKDDLVETLNAFCKNNLNVSATARYLHIHRNTLMYRLDKIQSLTGKDPRVFKEAMELQMFLWFYSRQI